MALLSTPYAWIGVVKTAEGTTLQMFTRPAAVADAEAAPLLRQTNAPDHQPDQSSHASVAARSLQL